MSKTKQFFLKQMLLLLKHAFEHHICQPIHLLVHL